MSCVLLKSLFLFRKYDVVLLGNALLAHIGWILKVIHRKPVITVAHGLDLTFNNWFYQVFWVGFFIKTLDKLISVGNETIRVAEGKGINKEKLVFIPNGLDIKKYAGTFFRTDLEKILKKDLEGKYVILTSGRLVKRKGVAWFIQNVMAQIKKI
jgi:glycosyltransferase involved in cell wall biosynthesis